MRRWSPLLLCSSLALAQGAPTFVPKPALTRVQVENVPALLAQLPRSRCGRLLAEEQVAAAWAAGVARYRDSVIRQRALADAVRKRGVELDPWVQSRLLQADVNDTLRMVELDDVQRFELTVVLGEDARPNPDFVVALGCRPRAEGRWTKLFEDAAQRLDGDAAWQREPDVKFGGFPLHQFRSRRDLPEDRRQLFGGDAARAWLMHLPGVFVFGSGTPEACGTMTTPPARGEAGFVAEMDFEPYLAMFRGLMGAPPREFVALGLDQLKALRWRGRFAGELALDEIDVETGGEPTGIVGALLNGKGTPPPQPLPAGALAQLRCAVDVAQLLDAVGALAGGKDLPDELRKTLQDALPGGVALGVCAPAAGGVLPRMFVSLAVGDDKALDRLIEDLVRKGGATKQVTYENVACTVLTLPDVPQGLQPAWCRVDGVLHVAESGPSLRAFLKARAAGGAAMDVGDAPVPDGAGELVPGFDLRYDAGALYRAFHAHWLPLVKLIPGQPLEGALVHADEMPEPDAVAPLLGTGRGVLRRAGNTWTLQQLGALGGLESTALAMVWGPLLSARSNDDWLDTQIRHAVAREQLAAVWKEVEAFHEKHQRWPRDLGELFTATKLPADALLLPGDTHAEPVALPAGDTRAIKSSFRWFAPAVKADVDGGEQALLLVGIAPCMAYRPMLTDKGDVPQTWGEICQRPIDRFGK